VPSAKPPLPPARVVTTAVATSYMRMA
jgi:hypothetical protein